MAFLRLLLPCVTSVACEQNLSIFLTFATFPIASSRRRTFYRAIYSVFTVSLSLLSTTVSLLHIFLSIQKLPLQRKTFKSVKTHLPIVRLLKASKKVFITIKSKTFRSEKKRLPTGRLKKVSKKVFTVPPVHYSRPSTLSRLTANE